MQHVGDREKLPKWAQSEIRRLEADVDYFRRKLTAGPENSDTFADPYSDARRPLGKGTDIQFWLDDVGVRASVRRDPQGKAYLDVNGGDSLSVLPWASNAVKIHVGRFW